MDRRNLKKLEQIKTERRDRGDNLKKVEKVVKKLLDSVEKVKVQSPAGDSEKKTTKVDKPKVIVLKKPEEVKFKVTEHHTSKDKVVKKDDKSDEAVKPDKVEKNYSRDKYCLKPRNTVGSTANKDRSPKLSVNIPAIEVKNDKPPSKPSELKNKIEVISKSESAPSENLKAEKKRDSFHRKPVIKTVTAKNDTTKVFKAVTFVDQKVKPTLIQIKIPHEVKNSKRTVETNTVAKKIQPTVSRTSVKEKIVSARRKVTKGRKTLIHPKSPDVSVRLRSPPTEVAKWVPSCINRHTKPYYEAWVSTTLAAISKNSHKDRLYLEKQNILQSFQKALAERPGTPELVYENFADEKYTGRIKVKQRS